MRFRSLSRCGSIALDRSARIHDSRMPWHKASHPIHIDYNFILVGSGNKRISIAGERGGLTLARKARFEMKSGQTLINIETH